MADFIDYDGVAEVYDLYASTAYDHDFFLRRISPRQRVLELTSGTGRLSIALAKAGAALTCVDISNGMLAVLNRKLKEQNLEATVVCADIQYIDFKEEFEVAILPFQSFMELVGRDKQKNALRAVYRALEKEGRFYCTMHNPKVRRRTVDGILRAVGTFERGDGHIVVSGFEVGGDPVVKRSQFIESYSRTGQLESRVLQLMEFEMINEGVFREIAEEVGFNVKVLYGDYEGGEFDANTSPVMIWELEKTDA